jgi:hypothetical protein
MYLSLKRVRVVKRYLASKGIHPDRIDETGKGESEPVARNQNPDGSDAPTGRFLNRHVKVTISGLENVDRILTEFYVPKSLRRFRNEGGGHMDVSSLYTIQIGAGKNRLDTERFRDLNDLKEYDCIDGYFRYTSGEFHTKQEAGKKLNVLKRSGYPDAYIQPVQRYINASK